MLAKKNKDKHHFLYRAMPLMNNKYAGRIFVELYAVILVSNNGHPLGMLGAEFKSKV